MFKAGLTTIIGALVFQTVALSQIYVKNPGNVGIGVSNPDFKLQVSGFTEIGDQNAHDPTKYGVLQLTRPANQGDEKFHLSFVRSGNTIAGMGYASNSNTFGIWVSPPQGTYSTPTIGIPSNGNVGIGTATPADKLHVMGNLRLSAGSEFYFADNGQIRSLDDNHRILFRRDENKMELREYGSIIFSAGAVGSQETAKMVVNGDGNVGIGTTTPAYKLHVAGEMRATRFWTEAGYDWADYVFDPGYHLPSLQEVKAYISKNHHLPEVPSTEDVKKDGINLSDNHVILLKKVEELTLYAIDQNEKLQLIEKKLSELMKENAVQKAEIKALKTKKANQ
jgi:hypothetical protein